MNNANALCLICGTTKEDSNTAFCINGHDNWLEASDEVERFSEAMETFGADLKTIKSSIDNNIDLEVVSIKVKR